MLGDTFMLMMMMTKVYFSTRSMRKNENGQKFTRKK